ncbi:MAG: AlkA N-terminal domain-containing protein, partial [Gemmatimonadota bacterium]
ETSLPVTQVAFASGFSSVTRFNALFHARYRLSPSRLRREAVGNGNGRTGDVVGRRDAVRDAIGATTLRLDYRPPLDWERLLRFLAARATPGVEFVADGQYARMVVLDGHAGWLEVRPATGRAAAEVRVSDSLAPVLMTVLARVRHLFDLDAEPAAIAEALGRDSRLALAVRRVPGLRLPGAFDDFEVAVRAVLGQQVSVRGATTLAGRLAAAFGAPVPSDDGRPGATPDELAFGKPMPLAEGRTGVSPGEAPAGEAPLDRLPVTAERLAGAAPETVARVGIPHSRARTIVSLARAVVDGELDLGPTADPDATMSALQEIRGIGPWTAQYVAMRALHWPDAFPAGDLGIRRALDGRDATAVAEAWRPWRAYAAMYLWEGLDTNEGEET